MSIKGSIAKSVIKLAGWRVECNLDHIPSKCVFCVAPHTSNWDFIVGKFCYTALDTGLKPMFLIKKEWTNFPFGLLIKPLGGIGVDRNAKNNLTETVIAELENHEQFKLAITPEGTRSRNANWKRGFYLIAERAKVPIVLVAIDYGRKVTIVDHIFQPTGDVKADMDVIKNWYITNHITAKYPENFAV